MRWARRSAGFTLIEVLAVVFLTSVVIALALDFYVELSRSTARAAALTRDIRRATGILDRVARDFEGTVLLQKEPEEDPLAHPWIFLGESRSSELGADHVKFDTFSHVARGSAVHEADLAVVSYITRDGLDSGVELLRWTSPRIPESLDRDFPLPEDEGVLLLADGLADFGVRFLGEDGEWTSEWDSSTLLKSSQLPLAVEIEVAMADDEGFFGEDEVVHFTRTVRLPIRPIDPADLSGEAAAVEEGDGEGGPQKLELTPELERMLTPEMRRILEEQGRL